MAIKNNVLKLKDGRTIYFNGIIEINVDFDSCRFTSIGTDLFVDLNKMDDKQVFSNGWYFLVVEELSDPDYGKLLKFQIFNDKNEVQYNGYRIPFYRESASGLRYEYFHTVLNVNNVKIPDGGLWGYPYTKESALNPPDKVGGIRTIGGASVPIGQWVSKPPNFYDGVEAIGASNALIKFLTNDAEYEEVYSGEDTGDDSGHGGQDGNNDNSTDVIDVPNLPTISASSCGLVDMYKLTLTQTKQLADFLWSNFTEFSENIKKIFSEPMDAIISLSLSPINPDTGAETEIKIANINSGVNGKRILNQYVTLDCGSINIPLYWGSALDYSPYTKATIYLPLIGNQVINIDDIMGKTVSVKYNIDLLTGSCVAFIICDNSVMYSYSGNVISQLPLSGKNALDIYKALITSVVNTGLAIGTGGASIGAQSIATLSASGMNVLGSKESVQRGGQITSTSGMLGVKYPIITILRAEQSRPKEFKSFKGYPSNLYARISELSGYTEIEYIHLDGIIALDSEKEELERLLKSGVIF